MKIAIGADHRGVEIKDKLKLFLKSLNDEVLDCGTNSPEPCDYPDIAYRVALKVSLNEVDRGILICMSGIGMTIAANKVKGIRAGLCHNARSAQLSRAHNDANVLVLASGEIGDQMEAIIQIWLETPFEGGRHQRRVDKITELDNRRDESS